MTKYLIDGKEVNEKEFDEQLEIEARKECDDENFCMWLDDYTAPYGIEIGGVTFNASDILYTMDNEEYNKQKEDYIQDQIDKMYDELEQSDYIVVANSEFSIKRED